MHNDNSIVEKKNLKIILIFQTLLIQKRLLIDKMGHDNYALTWSYSDMRIRIIGSVSD